MILDGRTKQPQLSPSPSPSQNHNRLYETPPSATKQTASGLGAAAATVAKPVVAAAAKADHSATAPKASQFANPLRRPKPASDEPTQKQQAAPAGGAVDEAPKPILNVANKLFGNVKSFFSSSNASAGR